MTPVQQAMVVAAIAIGIIAILCFSPTARRLAARAILGPPNLRIDELPGLFDCECAAYKRIGPGGPSENTLQILLDNSSIFYTRHEYAGGLAERFDISYPGKAGMIFDAKNGHVTHFTRVGGIAQENPTFSPREQGHLIKFMGLTRDYGTPRLKEPQ